jgi:hypothetical protein
LGERSLVGVGGRILGERLSWGYCLGFTRRGGEKSRSWCCGGRSSGGDSGEDCNIPRTKLTLSSLVRAIGGSSSGGGGGGERVGGERGPIMPFGSRWGSVFARGLVSKLHCRCELPSGLRPSIAGERFIPVAVAMAKFCGLPSTCTTG